ncbi:MAG: MFS transporter [Coriobacteriales bacterium]|jgi:DHA3 family macrolide efflux protein-like MFS transporter|nr:MFS transporter [Coriobacteriales bacterium]
MEQKNDLSPQTNTSDANDPEGRVVAESSTDAETLANASAQAASAQLTASGTVVPKGWIKTVGIVFSGQIFSLLTSAASGYALIWFLTITGSAMILVLGTVFWLLPMAFFSPLIGSLVDRYNRKHIMMLSNLFVAALTALMILFIVLGFVSVPLVLAMIALRSVGQVFHFTSMNAAIPLLVPDKHLVRVSSVTSGLGAASNIVGPAIGIVLFESFGLHIALSIDIVGALIAFSVLFFVSIPDVHLSKEEQTKIISEMRDGLVAIRQKVGMTPFFVLVAIACVFFMPMAALFPLMTVQHFGGDGYAAALIEAIWGTCFLAGTVALGIWGGGKRLTLLIRFSLGACALIVMACGLLPPSGYWWFFGLTGLMALTGVLFDTPLMAVVQKNIAPEKLGRVLSVFNSLISVASLIGLGLAGAVGDITGVAPIFVASGAGMFLVFVAAFFLPNIKKLDKLEEEEEDPLRSLH